MKPIALRMALLIGFMFSMHMCWAYDFEVDGIYYSITNEASKEVSVTNRGDNTKCYSGNITIPSTITYSGATYSITSIGDAAFSNCTSLNMVDIPNSVKSIGQKAFFRCSGLTSQSLPNSITSIGDWAFNYCTNLESLVLSNSLKTIGYRAFADCSALASVSLPNSITSIGNSAFQQCTSLTTISLSNSLKAIGFGTFYGCTSLTSIIIPDSVDSIGNNAFYECTNLTSIVIPDSVISIDAEVFEGTNLYNDESNWENGLLYIGNHLIRAKNVTGEDIIRPGTITVAGKAFYECSGLISVNIPNSVVSIGNDAFFKCASLTSVFIPNSVSRIGMGAFNGTALYNDESKWENGLLYIGNHLVATKNYASEVCIIKSGTITIAGGVFVSNKSLRSVTLPHSIASIGMSAFYGCTSLTSMIIPNSLTYLGDQAFYGCTGLSSVIIKNSPSNIILGDNVFSNVPTDECILYVPRGTRDLYKESDIWKEFVNIESYYVSLSDGEAYESMNTYKEIEVEYARTFNNTNWQALYLPFDMSYEEWSPYVEIAELYNVRGYDKNNDGQIDDVHIEFNRLNSGSIKPNVPYIVKAKQTGPVVFTCLNKTLVAAPAEEGTVECSSTKFTYSMHGIYQPKTDVYGTGVYYLAKGNFCQAPDATVTLAPYRFYLTITQKSGGYNDDTPLTNRAPQRIILSVDGETETTGLNEIFVTSPQDNIYYDLMGRSVENPKSGIYILNGQKIYLK